jgi:hypothetical protein
MTTPISRLTPISAERIAENGGLAISRPSQPFPLRPIWDYSFADIQILEEHLQAVRQSQGKESSDYIELKKHVAEVRMTRLPLRTYALWKQQPELIGFVIVQNDAWLKHYGCFAAHNKTHRKQFKALLMEQAQSSEMEAKLNFLSRLTFLHGTTSATLVLMAAANNYEIQPTGRLLERGIAPLCGELYRGGLAVQGVNVKFVSTETVRSIGRVMNYTSMSPFNPNRLTFHLDSPLKLGKDSWVCFALEALQLQQWDIETYFKKYDSLRQQALRLIPEEMQQLVEPLRKVIALIDHPFSEEEKVFVQDALAGKLPAGTPVPSSLLPLFRSSDEIPYFPSLFMTLEHTLEYYQHYFQYGQGDWKEFLYGNLQAKLNPANEEALSNQAKPYYENCLEVYHRNYEFALSLLKEVKPQISVPAEEKIRALITQPIPIIFSSTCVKFSPHKGDAFEAHEYLLTKPIPLGKHGANILFTDTEESKAKLRAILPEQLREEVDIHLFDELNVGPIPLMHDIRMVEPLS